MSRPGTGRSAIRGGDSEMKANPIPAWSSVRSMAVVSHTFSEWAAGCRTRTVNVSCSRGHDPLRVVEEILRIKPGIGLERRAA